MRVRCALVTNRSSEAREVQTQAMWGRRISLMAGLLLVVAGSITSCGARSNNASPSSEPVDDLSQHGGSVCPTTLPRAPRSTYGFGTEKPAAMVPTLSKPQRAWVCQYDAHNVARQGSNGAWYEWVRVGAPRRLDVQELDAFASAIGQLTVPSADRACTMDLGPRYLVSYTYKRDLTGVVIDGYGCRGVRLTDNPFTTVPGGASVAGIVEGVLAGPTKLLDDLNAG
jgi:hypothetical protein